MIQFFFLEYTIWYKTVANILLVNVALLTLLCLLLYIDTEAKDRSHSSSKLTPQVFPLIVDCLKVSISKFKKGKSFQLMLFSFCIYVFFLFSWSSSHIQKGVSFIKWRVAHTTREVMLKRPRPSSVCHSGDVCHRREHWQDGGRSGHMEQQSEG